MKSLIRFLFFFILILSPCSIKASIHQIVQKEKTEVNKTSPNKALSFEISNCDDNLSQSLNSSKKNNTSLIKDIPDFIFGTGKIMTHGKTIWRLYNSEISSQKLFILYSQLKIAVI